MILLDNGLMMFDDIYELTYNLLNAIGLVINPNGYLYDTDSNTIVQFQGRNIKATIDPNIPCFAGQGEVVFDILNNVRLVTTMLGYVIDKETMLNGFSSLSHYIDDEPTTYRSALCIKMTDQTVKSTLYYTNKCLKYIHGIFLVYEDQFPPICLNNFDVPMIQK